MQDAKTCKRGAGLASFSGGRGSRRRQLGGQGETQGALRSLLRGRAEGLGGPWRRLLRRGRLVSRAFPRRPCSLGLPEAGAGDPRRAGGRVHRAGLPARRSCTERARRDRWFLERRRGPRLLVVDRAEDAGPPTFPVLLATPGSSMNSNFSLASLVVWYVVFLFSTTFHEFSHAIVAYWGGDKTAHEGGQVSLDPMPHIRRSPFGLVLAPLVTFPLFGWMIGWASAPYDPRWAAAHPKRDRKSTRLNSSHVRISYAVFCLKKKIFALWSWHAHGPSRNAKPDR